MEDHVSFFIGDGVQYVGTELVFVEGDYVDLIFCIGIASGKRVTIGRN